MKRIKVKDGFISLENKPLIMGILNVTPDSFYDGGKYFDRERAIERAFEIINEGADIIDIGGESTRPGAEPVSLEEEKRRVLPVIKEIRKKSDIIISIDTYKSEVAEEALLEGANMVNDISGTKFDKNMPHVIKKYRAGCIVMHIRGTPKDMQKNPYYKDTIGEIKEEIEERISFLKNFGVEDEQIIIDPGIGFGKRVYDNLLILKNIDEFKKLNYPLLIGHSRKSFIGKIIGEEDPSKRKDATIAVTSFLILKKVDIIRVHDIKGTKEAKKILNSIEFPENYL
ncbi:MAG: dihydropteroate synthase [candidate division WOR-3 bacterium]